MQGQAKRGGPDGEPDLDQVKQEGQPGPPAEAAQPWDKDGACKQGKDRNGQRPSDGPVQAPQRLIVKQGAASAEKLGEEAKREQAGGQDELDGRAARQVSESVM